MLDVIIVGGSAAGLSAATILGRFRRSVLVCDSGQPRNAPSQGVHGFLSRDGILPRDLMNIAREQLTPYDSVTLRSGRVVAIQPIDGGHEVRFEDGETAQARKILLATGVRDILPDIPGLAALWGTGVFHCPYCHGWEARDHTLAILADGEKALHLAKLLHSLSKDIVICTDGGPLLTDIQRAQLTQLGVRVISTPIQAVEERDGQIAGLRFADGDFLAREAIFVGVKQQQHSDLPAQLGCAFTESGHVAVDAQHKTSIPGIFAAGDMSSPLQQVIYAAAQGAAAAAFINTELAEHALMQPA